MYVVCLSLCRISVYFVCLCVCRISMYFVLLRFIQDIDVFCFVNIYVGY